MSLDHLGPSPEHSKYVGLMPRYWERVAAQEKDLVDHGYPAEGILDFCQDWFDGWASQSVDKLSARMTEDITYIDSTSFGKVKERTLDSCRQSFLAFPDFAFYPQDDSIRSLPYFDFAEDELRVTIPWRGIGRQSGRFNIPDTDLTIAPTGRCINFIGVDRYTTVRDGNGKIRISHIDTDWDMLYYAIGQLSPIQLRKPPSERTLRAALAVERAIMPTLRKLGRVS